MSETVISPTSVIRSSTFSSLIANGTSASLMTPMAVRLLHQWSPDDEAVTARAHRPNYPFAAKPRWVIRPIAVVVLGVSAGERDQPLEGRRIGRRLDLGREGVAVAPLGGDDLAGEGVDL